MIGVHDFPNAIVNEGKNKLLNVMFHGVTAIGTWYMGLIDLTGYSPGYRRHGRLRRHQPVGQRLEGVHQLHRRGMAARHSDRRGTKPPLPARR